MINHRIKLIESDLRTIETKIEIIRKNSELERLAEIGKATEKALEDGYMVLVDDYMDEVEKLLEWYKESEAE